MGIRPVDYYLADKDKPTYYIFIYNKSKPPPDPKPNQILKSDTWDEARRFAVCFVGHTNLQYVKISALSPKTEEYTAWEIAFSDFWNADGIVHYTEQKMSAPIIKMFTEKMSCPVVEE